MVVSSQEWAWRSALPGAPPVTQHSTINAQLRPRLRAAQLCHPFGVQQGERGVIVVGSILGFTPQAKLYHPFGVFLVHELQNTPEGVNYSGVPSRQEIRPMFTQVCRIRATNKRIPRRTRRDTNKNSLEEFLSQSAQRGAERMLEEF